jgi:hypothetical protein
MLLGCNLVDFNSRQHGLVGLWSAEYNFCKKKPITCCTLSSIVSPIMQISKMAEKEFPSLGNENYSHCSIAIYKKGDFVCMHKDDESSHSHYRILSISLGDTCNFQLGTNKYLLQHGDVLKFNGKTPHRTFPLQGQLRINLTFRVWKRT